MCVWAGGGCPVMDTAPLPLPLAIYPRRNLESRTRTLAEPSQAPCSPLCCPALYRQDRNRSQCLASRIRFLSGLWLMAHGHQDGSRIALMGWEIFHFPPAYAGWFVLLACVPFQSSPV